MGNRKSHSLARWVGEGLCVGLAVLTSGYGLSSVWPVALDPEFMDRIRRLGCLQPAVVGRVTSPLRVMRDLHTSLF